MSMIVSVVARIWRRCLEIPQRGLPKPAARDDFDSRYGVRTSGVVWLTAPRNKNFVEGIRYEACPEATCRAAIDLACINPAEFTFVDIGCGKGRPLLIASEYGFRELIGIEYSSRLCRTAERNLKLRGVSRFRIVNADATEFEYPRTNILAFLGQPFGDAVLARVLVALRAATQGNKLIISYVGERYGAILSDQDWLTLAATGQRLRVFRKSE